jgi:glycosyltransferase involved in cell wall biosynthesis
MRKMMDNRLHIGQFTNFYHPVVNGVVHSVSLYRDALTRLGHNVFVFAQQVPDHEDDEPFIFRYPTIPLPTQTEISAVVPISRSIDRLLPSLKLDVIHTHHPFLLGQVAVDKSEELGVPLVFTFHTRYRDYSHYFPLPQEFVQDFIKTAIDSWLGEFMENCHHVIVPSGSMLKVLEEGYGLTERVTAIPTGIDTEPYISADREAVRQEMGWGDDTVLITVGRLAAEKNMTVLLDAAAQVIETFPQLRVVLVGDGQDKSKLEEHAAELGIANRVEFTGSVPFERIPGLLKAADVFGFASVTETQGMVTMEALAAGLPVAAVEASGTRDVITDGVDGILTENDPAALAGAIRSILEDPDRVRSFREAALRKAESFDIDYLATRVVDVYRQAIEDQKAGRKISLDIPKLINIDWKLFPGLSEN